MDLIVDKKFRRHPKRKIEVYIPDAKTAKMSIPRSKLNRKSLQEINIQSIVYGKGFLILHHITLLFCHTRTSLIIKIRFYLNTVMISVLS